ncbi:unnamed protein product [Rotaria magnacalcarata]
MDDTLYILGGKLTYEFIRLNIVGALPSLTTLYGIISDTNLKIIEGQFRFDELKHHSDLLNTKFGFVSEDCTGVVQKITYNERTNSFVGFSAPLTNGIPHVNHFQTDSFEQLKTWFSTVNKASLLNVHMFQPIPSNHLKSSSSFVLAVYGVNNQCTSIDILKRWSYIYDECYADAKYLSAMRLTSGFFANLTNIKLHENDDAFKINIPSHWTWFFLRSQQLFLFFQDATHVATKWRNRLLASTAHLVLGQQPITMQHLQNIIDNGYNKLDHGLVYTDLNPKDKQNYTSCEKIASEDVLNILKHNRDTQATYVYLRLLKRIIIAYVERSTNIKDRLHSAWTVVFTCRLWKLWIKHNIFTRSNSTKKDETKKSKDK